MSDVAEVTLTAGQLRARGEFVPLSIPDGAPTRVTKMTHANGDLTYRYEAICPASLDTIRFTLMAS